MLRFPHMSSLVIYEAAGFPRTHLAGLQVMCLWPYHSHSDQSASYEDLTVHLKTTMAARKEDNVAAAFVSVISELQSISSLKKRQV